MTTSDFLRLAEHLHHLLGGLGGVGERDRACAAGVEDGLLAHQSEDAKAYAAALDHGVAADRAGLGQALQVGQRGVVLREIGIRGDHRRDPARPGRRADGLGQAVRPEVEIVVAEGGGVVTHPRQQLQFAAGLADGGAERGPHAVVARIEHQDRALSSGAPLSCSRSGWPDARTRRGSCRR